MGIRIELAGQVYEGEDYSVEEDSTPLSAGDSSGGVGTITVTLVLPDRNVARTDPFWLYGADWFIGEAIRLSDTRKGFTLGTVTGCSVDDTSGKATLTCLSRLAKLNIFNVNAQPYIGTLGGAFAYYAGLAGVTTDLLVDSTITSRAVVLQGFTGDLWVRLKQMAVAQDCDISLVSGVILLRPIRTRVAIRGRDVARSATSGSGSLAQSVEVYWYNTTAITNGLVYPPGGWTPQTEVLNVNAGETAEYQLQLSASVSAIQTPVMNTSIGPTYSSSSVYTIVADDGYFVLPAMWAALGGSVTVTINPDTSSLTVKLVGAVGVPLLTGGYSKAFSLALASDTSGSRYSTLRIVGTGVSYERTLETFSTGISPDKTATEVGETIDNPFLTDYASVTRAGLRAANRWSGLVPALAGSVTAINQMGDSGVASYPSYASVQAALTATLGAPTYASVQTWYVTTEGLPTYGDVQDYWFSTVQNEYANQVFGNVSGARVWDKKRRRWYRIRSGTLTPGGIAFTQTDDDLLNSDMQTAYAGITYGIIQGWKANMTYQQSYLAGVYLGQP